MLVFVIVISVVALFACTTFVCSAVANKKFFGRRYNGNPLLKYFTAEDFPNLDAEAVSFVSDKGQMLKGYVYTSSAVRTDRIFPRVRRGAPIVYHRDQYLCAGGVCRACL